MAQNLSNYASVLKNVYLGPIRTLLNSATVLLKRLERDEESISGKNATIPVRYGRNAGVGARADGGTLPTAGQQAYSETIVPMRYEYGRIKVTGPTIAASRDNNGAFVKAVDSEMKYMVEDIKTDINRQFFNDGSGALTQANGSGTSSLSLIVDSIKYFEDSPNMIIDVYTAKSGGSQEVNSITVSAITSSSKTLTLNTASTWSDNSYVFKEDNRGIEMMGLKGIIDAATYVTTLQSVSRSTYDWWNANVLAGSPVGTNRALTLDLIQQAIDLCEQGGGKVSLIIGGYPVRRKYLDLLVADKRFVGNYTMKLDGGFEALDYNTIPFVVDKDCGYNCANTIFFVDESTLKIYRQSDFDWMDSDGAILSRVSGEDAYEAVLYHYGELGCDDPGKSCVLRDITE